MPVAGTIREPPLRSPYMIEEDAKKTQVSMFDLGHDGWVVLYTRKGRAYYFHPESGMTQWEHPKTGVYSPPVSDIGIFGEMPSPTTLRILNIVGWSFTIPAFF
eukprot:2406961-Amphidinium_carterae.1